MSETAPSAAPMPPSTAPTDAATPPRGFGVYVHRVGEIVQHPTADTLTLVRLSGHDEQLVANKRDDGVFRYAVNDLVLLLPVGALLPQWLLADMDALRTNSKGKVVGMLGGNKGNRIVPRVFSGTPSNGMLRRLEPARGAVPGNGPYGEIARGGDTPETRIVAEGDDVAAFLGVAEHVG